MKKKKRGFSRFIAFLMIREAVRVISNKENRLFDKFNECIGEQKHITNTKNQTTKEESH